MRCHRTASVKRCGAFAALGLLAAAAGGEEPRPHPWPPFLPPRSAFTREVVAAVEWVWSDPTITRTVRGPRVRVPSAVYAAFVDAPEVTAAAGRTRGLANYEVRRVGANEYGVDDHAGARGTYRVLIREDGRRVILSQGEHDGPFLGKIRESALSILRFGGRGDAVDQTLTAYVRIDNRVLARLARALIGMFGGLADRKLLAGFDVTATVAEWAVDRPDTFCPWLRSQPPSPGRRALDRALPKCRGMASRGPSETAARGGRLVPVVGASADLGRPLTPALSPFEGEGGKK